MRVPQFIENAYDWVRYDLPAKVDRRILIGGGVVAALLLVALLVSALSGDGGTSGETREVTVAVQSDNPQETPVGTLGFPLVATRNTTRVSGPDPIADAAATALASHPPAPSADPIEAAVLVPDGDWQAGVAASVLAGPPLRAPLLIGQGGGVPDSTAQALAQLKPRGGSTPSDVAVYRIGDVAAPSDLRSDQVKGSSPADLAAAVDKLRLSLLKTEPSHIVIASSDQAAYSMPAASWAARSGDPVLFTGKDQVPEPTLAALHRHQGVSVYVLGPESVISPAVMREIERVAPGAQRVGEQGPVANAIAFARYSDSSFGWGINDPGHGLVLANVFRPLDAAAAATLSSSGKWGPLLLTDSAKSIPPDLRSFLLDIKPGFQEDPTRAVYNHIWLIGDTSAIGASPQAEMDDIAELTQIGAATTAPGAGGTVGPTGAEGEPDKQLGKAKP